MIAALFLALLSWLAEDVSYPRWAIFFLGCAAALCVGSLAIVLYWSVTSRRDQQAVNESPTFGGL